MDEMTKSKFKTSMGLSMFSLSMNRLSLANPASSYSQKIEFISELICLNTPWVSVFMALFWKDGEE